MFLPSPLRFSHGGGGEAFESNENVANLLKLYISLLIGTHDPN